MLNRRLLLASPALLSLPARGQTWPARPIRIIVPYPAGQTADILGRLMAEQLTAALGQQVIVENKPGAGGTIGVDVAAKAAQDGYTLVIITISTHIIARRSGEPVVPDV
ncbi:hypothetical protein BH10PSE6_BH10PSE6_12190 [soil metagenome]